MRILPMLIPQVFRLTWSITQSSYAMKRSGDRGSPFLVPTSLPNQSPFSFPIRTADCASSWIVCRRWNIFVSTPYHFSVDHMILCLITSNTFSKSIKQLYIFFPCRFAFSVNSLSVRIWCTVLLSFLKPACSSEIVPSSHALLQN
jgi:hypothetical protein